MKGYHSQRWHRPCNNTASCKMLGQDWHAKLWNDKILSDTHCLNHLLPLPCCSAEVYLACLDLLCMYLPLAGRGSQHYHCYEYGSTYVQTHHPMSGQQPCQRNSLWRTLTCVHNMHISSALSFAVQHHKPQLRTISTYVAGLQSLRTTQLEDCSRCF